MAKEVEQTTSNTHRRLRFATAVVALLVLLVGLVLLFIGRTELLVSNPNAESGEVVAVEPEGPYLSASQPNTISIPKINVKAPFEAPLGVMSSGEIEVPEGYESVAYYEYGPTPGELGPAVVLGHVDSREGPAVFFSLGQLEEGDEITIDREDGTSATFAVTKLERHAQDGFPTAEVYGDLPYAGLRLITCTGIYDRNEFRYTHNLIVFAKLVSTSTTEGQ